MTEPAGPLFNDEAYSPPPRRREPMFNLPAIVLVIIGLCVAIHLIRTYLLTPRQDLELLIAAAFIPVRYSGQYAFDFWTFSSPFTYTFLHGGIAHIAVNMIWLAAFGSPLANRFGAWRFAIFYAVTGVAAAAMFWAIHPLSQSPLVGASGSISGMMGAAARFAFHIDRSSGKPAFAGAPIPMAMTFRSRTVVTFLAAWMIINLITGVIGFAPGNEAQIAWEAHVGGFLVGFCCLRFFDRRHSVPKSNREI